MSSRFGRNKKRRYREALKQVRVLENAAAGYRRRIDRFCGMIDLIKARFGEMTTLLPPETRSDLSRFMDQIRIQSRQDPFLDFSRANPYTIEQHITVIEQMLHHLDVSITTDDMNRLIAMVHFAQPGEVGLQWRYAISDAAVRSEPRRWLAEMVSKAVSDAVFTMLTKEDYPHERRRYPTTKA